MDIHHHAYLWYSCLLSSFSLFCFFSLSSPFAFLANPENELKRVGLSCWYKQLCLLPFLQRLPEPFCLSFLSLTSSFHFLPFQQLLDSESETVQTGKFFFVNFPHGICAGSEFTGTLINNSIPAEH